MERIFHTPDGLRDITGRDCENKRKLQEKIHRVFKSYGYQDIQTPGIEFFEVFANEVGTIPSRELYRFFDREGNTLALRADFTPSISRACATYFDPEKEPVTLCYAGSTFVNSTDLQGRPKEATQMGVERIGDASVDADAELLAMTAECLLACGLTEFQISAGQVGYFKSLVREAGLDEETELRLRSLISQKNSFGVEELLSQKEIDPQKAAAFSALPGMFGGREILDRARSFTKNEEALAAADRLEEIYGLLSCYGFSQYLSFDFSMLSKYRYYTGLIFQAYTYGTGEPVVKGGRYDRLLRHFGKPAAAAGFAIVVDSLMLALQSQGIRAGEPEPVEEIVYEAPDREKALLRAKELRSQGRNVRLCRREEK